MNPQTSTTSSLDPQAVALAKAIRQTESGGNFQQKGASGEYGAYQWLPSTWQSMSADAGVNVPLEQATPEQQNEVAYKQIKKWKDAGYNVGQIASMWNAGEGAPNAYLEAHKGVNAEGVSYDTPKYAKNVATLYQQYKQGTPQETQDLQQNVGQQKSDFLDKVRSVLTTIFPGTEQIGESLGTAALNIGKLAKGESPDIPVNIPKTIGGYLQAGATAAAPGVGGETAFGRIASTSGLGALTGAGSALASGGDAIKGGITGGIAGGAAGGVGELISKAAQYLPYSVVRKFLPGISSDTAEYAVQKGLGSVRSMANQSDRSLSKIGSGIEQVLTHPSLEGVTATAPDVFQPIIDKYPNAGLTPDIVADELKKLAPLQKGLVDKLSSEGLNAKELNNLKSAIGENTYKMRFDEPAVKAGKDIGNTAYAAISQWLKGKIPEAAPLFDEYSKELQLNGALQQAIRRGEKAKFIGLPELLSMLGGFSALGLPGGVGALALEKAVRSPSVNLLAGKAASSLATPAAGLLGRIGTLGGISALTGAQGNQTQ